MGKIFKKIVIGTLSVALAVVGVSTVMVFIKNQIAKSSHAESLQLGRNYFDFEKEAYMYSDSEKKVENPLYRPDSQRMYNFYNRSTSSIFVGKKNWLGQASGSLGTIWSYPNDPNKFDGIYYFMTNIHVIESALQIRQTDSGERFLAINPDKDFFVNRNKKGELEIYGRDIYKVELANVKLESIGLSYQNKTLKSKLNFNSRMGFGNDMNFYSDFCILSTTTNPFSHDKREEATFATAQEIERYVLNDMQDLYLAGFPATKSSSQPNIVNYYHSRINYKDLMLLDEEHEGPNGEKIYFDSPAQKWGNLGIKSASSTARDQLRGAYNKSGLTLFEQRDPNTNVIINGYPVWSYARQLLLPNAIVGGGSSGSMLTTMINGQIKIVGIWWGGYEVGSNLFIGGVDMLVTNDYRCEITRQTLPEYNNTYIDPSTLNWKYWSQDIWNN